MDTRVDGLWIGRRTRRREAGDAADKSVVRWRRVVVGAVAAVTLLAGCSPASSPTTAAPTMDQAAQDEALHQAAVDEFNGAATGCVSANADLTSAISAALPVAKTKTTDIQNPALIDALKSALTAAQAVPACATPTMASDTSAIRQQATDLRAAWTVVTKATSNLNSATAAVTASVQDKKDEDAAAVAAAKRAAQTGTASFTDKDGYSYSLSWTVSDIAVSEDPTQGKPGTTRVTWSATINWTQTNTTPQKQASGYSVVFFPLFGKALCGEYALGGDSSCMPIKVFPKGAGMDNGYPPNGTTTLYADPWGSPSTGPMWTPVESGVSWKGTLTWPVGPSDFNGGHLSMSYDCPNDQLQAFETDVTAPAGWAAGVDWGSSFITDSSRRACNTWPDGSCGGWTVIGLTDSLQ